MEYERVATALTVNKGAKHRYGTGMQVYPNQIFDQQWPYYAFGGSVLDATQTRQVLSSPGGLAAGRWMYHHMFWPGIASHNYGPSQIVAGNIAMAEIQAVNLLAAVGILQRAGIRDLLWLPTPVYPQGHYGFISDNLWCINAETKHADAAWELLKWLTVDTFWQKWLAKVFLQPPCLLSLWPEYTAIVENVVPALKGRGLKWFTAAAQGDWGFPMKYFLYSDMQAEALDNGWVKKLTAHQIGVNTAYTQADGQVNAFEAALAPAAKAGAAHRA